MLLGQDWQMHSLSRSDCWLHSRPDAMFSVALRGRIGILWSGPGRPSRICFLASSTCKNLPGTLPFPQRFRMRCGRSGSLWPASLMPLWSRITRWVSRWYLQVAPLHCSGRGASCHLPTCPWRRYGCNECICEWLYWGLSSRRILCTRSLAFPGMHPRRQRQTDSWRLW